MNRLVLPAADHSQSEHTGWTRAHWETLADHLLGSLVPYVSPGAARVILPGRPSRSGTDSDELEGFARSFMLAAFRIAGARGTGCEPLIERYARGVANGANPDHPEAWPRITRSSQPMVEAAAVAVALHETREWIWDRLDPQAQEQVAQWLGGFIGAVTPDNNWRLFQVVSEQFLASVGAPFSQDDIDRGLDRIEDWYLGDGWYSDGDGQNFDNYIGWAMHLYPGLWARMAAVTPGARYEDRLKVYRERLNLFLDDAVHLVGGDGAPVYQGRSLTYRMAAATPYWMGQILDASPITPGATRRLCSGIARHFVQHGVPDERGLLTLGWYDAFLPTTQSYSGPGSPYWASKGFIGLLLPPEHPVWSDPEDSVPLDEADQIRAMPVPGWLVHSTRRDQVVRLLNHGSDHAPPIESQRVEPAADPHYDRLAFANHAGPEVSETNAAGRVDNMIALVSPDGRSSTRGRIRRIAVGARSAASWHQAWLGGDGPWRIETASVVHGGWEIRCALVDGPAGTVVRSGGFAIADSSLPTATERSGWTGVQTENGLMSVVVGLHGYSGAGVHRDVGANPFGLHSATPYLTADHSGDPLVLVHSVLLARDAESSEVPFDVEVFGHEVRIRFPEAETEVVRLGTSDV